MSRGTEERPAERALAATGSRNDADGKLRAALSRMERAVGALDDAVVWTGLDGLVQWCNPAFGRLTGLKNFGNLGKPLTDLLPLMLDGKPVPDRDHPVSRVIAAQGAGLPIRGRYMTGRSGAERVVEMHCSLQSTDACGNSLPGDARTVVLLMRDITEHVFAERWLEQAIAKAELLRKVAAAANEAETAAEAVRTSLVLLCKYLGWPAGHVFPLETGTGHRILPADCSYLANPVRYAEFRIESERQSYLPGQGLPGAIYHAGSPLWRYGGDDDPRFSASGAGTVCGLRTVFGFPILAGREAVAIVELCTDRDLDPDPDLSQLGIEIGTHLGRTFERRRAAAAVVHAKEELERRVAERTADLSALNESLIKEVAERHQIEAALRESMTRYHDLIHSVRDVMFSISLKGRVESLNPAFEKITGLAASDWIGGRLLPLVHPDDRRELHSRLSAAAAGGSPPAVEVRVGSASGAWITVECILAPKHSGGTLSGVLGIARDITERRRAEEQLRLHERAIESASEGIFLIDAASDVHPIIYANCAVERITGFATGQILGRCWLSLFQSVESDALQYLEQCVAERTSATREIEAIRAGGGANFDGAPYWCRIALTPVLDASSRLTHFVGILSDISQQKETERLKNELVATVSHELRTPLTSLRGFAELMLERDYPPEKRKKFLGIINKEATRLANLINDFLDIQRIESGRQVYHFDCLGLNAVLLETATLFRGGNPNHEFRLDISRDLSVWADAERIRQVLANLLSNAVKFSPQGGAIEIGLHEEAGFARCSITDSGIGIPPEGLAKLFQKFYRVDNAETRKIGGTGLGLSLVKQIVEGHKGEVTVESAPGRGSSFSFTLPLC